MKFIRTASVLALALGTAGVAQAQTTATQTVTYTVNNVNTIGVTGTPAALIVNAGGTGSSAADSSTTYDITTNDTTAKVITAQITTGGAMPTGVTLSVELRAPVEGGASAGEVTLSDASASNVVTGLTQLTSTGNKIIYRLVAGPTATAEAAVTRVITYTIQ